MIESITTPHHHDTRMHLVLDIPGEPWVGLEEERGEVPLLLNTRHSGEDEDHDDHDDDHVDNDKDSNVFNPGQLHSAVCALPHNTGLLIILISSS